MNSLLSSLIGPVLVTALLPTASGMRSVSAQAVTPSSGRTTLAGADWSAEGDLYNAFFGICVDSAGDCNGDGFEDIVIGAEGYSQCCYDAGRAFAYYGSSTGLPDVASWTVDGTQADLRLGNAVAGAGDVNGDGFDDVLVGAFLYNDGYGQAFLYLGSPRGLEDNFAWVVEGQKFSRFGDALDGVGDVNADGYDDVIIGGHGMASVYLGSAQGLPTVANWTVHDGGDFGASVAGAGDVNGDGYKDILVGAPDWGRARIYLGSGSGIDSTPAWTADLGEGSFGAAVAPAGDVNSDGFDDVLIGQPQYGGQWGENAYEGRAFMYLGNASGAELDPAWIVESDAYHGYLGSVVAAAGDRNSDGFDDVFVSCACNGESVRIYLGWSGGLSDVPAGEVSGPHVWSGFGASVSSTGDVNGDGGLDVLIGAPSYENGQDNEGGAFVYTSIPLGCGRLGNSYCSVNPNSTGNAARIEAWCSASAAEGTLFLEAAPVPNQFGVFFHGLTPTEVPFGNGYQCVRDDLARGQVIIATGNLATYPYDNSDSRHSLAAFVGMTRYFQYWFRDAQAGGAFFNTSDAVSILIQP